MKNKKIFTIIISLIIVITIILSIVYTKSKTESSISYIKSNTPNEAMEEIQMVSEKDTQKYVEGQVIIMTKPRISLASEKQNRKSILSELKIEDSIEFKNSNSKNTYSKNSTNSKNIPNDFTVSLVSSDKYSTEQLIENLKDEVEYVEPNYILHTESITNDPYLPHQWAIENNAYNGSNEGSDINPIKTTSENEKIIAVIDTGVDYTHEDLKDIMWNNPYKDSTDLPGQYGYDFGDDDTNPMDIDGHGTHCAGIIAATSNNNKGITGAILDEANIKIMALKLSKDEEENSKLYNSIQAYNYIYTAQQKGVNIVAINNSWGHYSETKESVLSEIIDLVGENGALSICAAGNDSKNTDTDYHIPSSLDNDYIISVAASDEWDNIANFSNYGATTVDIAAPGVDILSTVPYNVFNPSIYTIEERARLCSKYEDFEGNIEDVKAKITNGTIEKSSSTYWGNEGNSLQWNLENAEENAMYALALPLDVTNTDQYFNFRIKTTSPEEGKYVEPIEKVATTTLLLYYYPENFDNITNITWSSAQFYTGYYVYTGEGDWKNISTKVAHESGTLLICYYPYVNGNFKLNIDDFAISSSTASGSDFGKYDFKQGTSMATPYVTAAVGTVSNKYNISNALEIKEKVLKAVRKSDYLTSKVATGGTLDFSKLPTESSKMPTLNLKTTLNETSWSNSNTIEVQNIEIGKEYEYSINDGSTWQDCTDNKIVLTEDGIYQIKVREKNSTVISGTYFYKLDKTAPVITVSPDQLIEENEQLTLQVTASDISSGLKSNNIEYAFSTSTSVPSETSSYREANLIDGKVAITPTVDSTGTYYLYIKTIQDNAGNSSGINIHKYGPYNIKISIPVTGITINKNNITLHPGEQEKLIPSILPEGAITTINWTSSSPEIATVSTDGTITAINKGTTTITATTEDGEYSVSCDVNVIIALEAVILSLPNENIKIGDTLLLQPVLTPTNASISSIEWLSSKNDVATVNNGLVTALSEGTTVITATVTDSELERNTKIAQCTITVEKDEEKPDEPILVTALTLNKKNTMMHQGSTEKLTATVLPEEAIPTINWTSTNPEVATVSTDGTITAVNKGTTTITATTADGNFSDTCEVTVIVPLQGITLENTVVELNENTTQKIDLIIMPSNADIESINWLSEDEDVVNVDGNGLITALNAGETYISVTVEDKEKSLKTATCKVTVIKSPEEDEDTEQQDSDEQQETKDNKTKDDENIDTTTKKATNKDNTTAKEILPKTGLKGLIITISIVLFLITIIFIRYKSFKDIK